MNVYFGILIPFVGTTLGAACVFLMKEQMGNRRERGFTGFAAGVMVAASIWSLLIPSIENSKHLGRLAFGPAAIGFLIGMGFLLLLDELVPHIHQNANTEEGLQSTLSNTTKLMLAVTIHNIPEGIAVGVVFAEIITKGTDNVNLVSSTGALALAIGIAIQNFPEGAIISMPLQTKGFSKAKSFLLGTLSGAVEPIASLITILLAGALIPAQPYLLGFAAGAMIYVVVEELIPEMSQGRHSNVGVVAFAIGFTLMMVLDVALG